MLALQQTMAIPTNLRLWLGVPGSKPVGTGVAAPVRFEEEIPATMRLSENALAKDWDSPEEDAAWQNL